MFFHIDESGNTGNNLFDANQPRLSYGLLSSKTNVDALGQTLHRKMLKAVDQPTLHANLLGVDRLTRIAPLLIELQEKMKFDFDYYFIDKPAYALVLLFDAIFDAGLNEAVKWDIYWTPLRFLVIHKLGTLVDDDLLKEGWRLCTHRRIDTQATAIVALLNELKARALASNLDPRSKEILCDAFSFGIIHPLSLDFGTGDDKIISPNAVAFQFVVSAMARRLRNKGLKDATSIIVDQQTQFNRAQIGTHHHQKLIAESMKRTSAEERQRVLRHPLYRQIGSDEVLQKGMPQTQIAVSSSNNSVGLQIVDVYLWITNRMITDADLSPELRYLGGTFLKRALRDGISMDGMAHRFEEFERLLPTEEALTEKQREFIQTSIENHRAKIKTLGI
jgi:uncharacterized protein DUF3800